MRLLLLAAAVAVFSTSPSAQTGALDPTFGTNGTVVFDPSGTLRSGATDAAVLPDGRVLLSGRIGADAAVVRLSAAGALDPAFGQGGIVRVSLNDVKGVFTSLVVLPDETVLAAGGSQAADDTPTGAALVQISPAGAVTRTVREAPTAASLFFALAVQADGRVVAVGQTDANGSGSRFAAVRYLTDGARDVSFGAGGLASPEAVAGVTFGSGAVAVDAQGRLVASGIADIEGSVFDTEIRTFRLTPAGALDVAFGSGGVAVAPFGPGFNASTSVALDAEGRTVVSGSTIDLATGLSDLILLRYETDGTLDDAFGSAGVVRVGSFGPAAIAFDVALQSDGRILAGGAAGPGDAGDFLLARFTDTGALDTAFGTGGRTLVDLGANDIASALAFAADGRVVLAGSTGDAKGEQTSFAVARFTTDGRPLPADEAPQAAAFALSAAPNPFASASTLRLALDEARAVRIDVTDALGRTVAVLHDGALGPGEHAFRLDGAALAPGVYVVRATGGAPVRIVRR